MRVNCGGPYNKGFDLSRWNKIEPVVFTAPQYDLDILRHMYEKGVFASAETWAGCCRVAKCSNRNSCLDFLMELGWALGHRKGFPVEFPAWIKSSRESPDKTGPSTKQARS